MTKLAANLSMLYQQSPFLERFSLASKDGFRAVEFLFPYEFKKEDIGRDLKENELQIVLHNLPAGDWAAGERGIACLPNRADEFRAGVKTAIEYATYLGVSQLNCLAGIKPENLSDAVAEKTLIENLKFAAGMLKAAGIKLLLEPINNFDIPGFFVNSTKKGLEIILKVESENIFLQYDIYHAQRMEGEIALTIHKNLSKIAHIQIADNPGRNEPGTGEINYKFLFEYLNKLGYQGWIGCEYKPQQDSSVGLKWIKEHGIQI